MKPASYRQHGSTTASRWELLRRSLSRWLRRPSDCRKTRRRVRSLQGRSVGRTERFTSASTRSLARPARLASPAPRPHRSLRYVVTCALCDEKCDIVVIRRHRHRHRPQQQQQQQQLRSLRSGGRQFSLCKLTLDAFMLIIVSIPSPLIP